MLSKDQSQHVAGGATAVQAAGNVSITTIGLSYSEVRDVALDVFRANFYQLAGPAMETAKARAEEITENFLHKLQNEYPDGFKKGQDPDFQHALFTVQKEFARNGDRDLGDLLVDLLVDRSKQDLRDILQIVLNESLATAPKLTNDQLAVLAIIFLFRYTQNHGVGNHDLLGKYLDAHVLPFTGKLTKSSACYQHLEFTGCGSIQMTDIMLEQVFEQTYKGQFLKGFEQNEILTRGVSIGLDDRFFVVCLNDPNKIQVKANNNKQLDLMFETHGVNHEDRTKITELFEVGKMTASEIQNKCVEIRPYMKDIFDNWTNSQMRSFTLTSVGMAIGHANVKRLVGEFASLSVWIN